MFDDDTFLAAVLEEPDNDTLRLIYADWLDEKGQVRGEFIRIQCAKAKAADDDPSLPIWEARERELLGKHEVDWVRPIRYLIDAWEFHRGFVEQVTMRPGAKWSEVLELAPIRHIHFYQRAHATLQEVRVLAQSPGLKRLLTLKLNTDRGIRDDSVAVLACCPHLSGLLGLDLSDNWIHNEGARLLAESPYLSRLRRLRLEHNLITRDGKRALRATFGERVLL
jgi:uncharacterized protein (TIGR02996 family)